MSSDIGEPQPIPTGVPRWMAARVEDLLWSEWDGEYVLFHRPSGRTHLLNEPAWLLLNSILREPRDVESAASELADLRSEIAREEINAYVSSLVLRFEELGLVTRA